MGDVRDDGGQAFPTASPHMMMDATPGMSLRDWFAGQALMGEMAAQDGGESFGNWTKSTWPHLAKNCYGVADAMLAARKEQP